jgi:hypothetical protein
MLEICCQMGAMPAPSLLLPIVVLAVFAAASTDLRDTLHFLHFTPETRR